MAKEIRFRFAPKKTLNAVLWMLEHNPQKNGLDFHTILKTCYFADKEHLNLYRRPVFGATYRAMKYGPVPLEVYEMLKCDPLWLQELDLDAFPWEVSGYRVRKTRNGEVDLDILSESDFEILQKSFARASTMTFDERTRETHGTDWQNAAMGYMRYEDMLDENETKADDVAYLREMAPRIRI